MKLLKKLLVVLLVVCMMTGVLTIVAACNKDCGIGKHTDDNHDGICDVCSKATVFKHVDADGDKKCDTCGKDIVYTMNDYVSTTPSNWNELSSTDANDDAIMGYIGSSFFGYDFKFDGNKRNADGTINAAGIIDGEFEVTYEAATALEDVTEEYAEEWDYLTAAQVKDGGYIWKITLRDDLKWDDGTPIKAQDFVYTMEQQLDPNFQLERASEYYNNAVKIHNAKNYLYQGQKGWFTGRAFSAYSEDLDDMLIFSLGNPEENAAYNGVVCEVRTAIGFPANYTAEMVAKYLIQNGINNKVDATVEEIVALEGKTLAEIKADPAMEATWKKVLASWQTEPNEELDFFVVNYEYPEMDFSEVGIFAEGDYDIVLVCDSPMQFFKDDGTLSYLAAYNFASLPLVKKDLYEQCKHEPQAGSTLWTTTYNTSLETSASWGPFKLTYFQAGRQFELSRNDNWYGYALEENKGLYPVDKIVTQVIETEASAQLAFWKGQVDSLGISVTIADDYKNSPYAIFSPRVATFGVQVQGNLDALVKSGRNNGILAIPEFREALSLSLDRNEYNRRLSTANQPCLGLMGEDYYYDVENGGVYRYSKQGQAALLRTYGFEQNAQGQWVDSATGTVYASQDEAVEAMTGVNLPLAKELVEKAYKELVDHKEKYNYDETKNIEIQLGADSPGESVDRTVTFMQEWVDNLTSGTSLEGKVKITSRTDLGEEWAEKFRDGTYELSTSGIGNAPFDPFYLMAAHLGNLPQGSSVSYHLYWDVTAEDLAIAIPEVEGDYDLKGETATFSVAEWYNILNSQSQVANLGAGFAPAAVRLEILARLEECILKHYYTLPTSRGMTAALGSAKWSYITKTYNTMLGFGGMKYMTFNYADDEWAAFVQMYGGDLRDFYKG